MIKRVERSRLGPGWEVYIQSNGRKVYVGIEDSLRAAKELEQDELVTRRKIDSGELPPRLDTKRTLAAGAAQWVAHLEKQGSRSLRAYKGAMDLYVLPTLQGVPIANIKRHAVLTWRDALNTGAISPATINAAQGALSSAFSYFIDQQWIGENPCRGIRMLPKKQQVFPWLDSSEVITRLLGECTPNVRNLVAVLVGTGMRLDEALHLRWDDIDLDRRIVTVHRGRKGTTKSGRMRRVPIFDSVLPVLRAMRLERGSNVLLWPGARQGRALSQPSVRKPFKRAADHAGLSPKMRLHDLRHSFASLFLIDGGDIFKLSRILGHSSVTITERTYAHLKPDAFESDYGRVSFRMPTDAKVIQLVQSLNLIVKSQPKE